MYPPSAIDLYEDLDALAQSVASVVRAHDGRLAALTIGVPPGTRPDIDRLLEGHLAEVGLDFVDVRVRVGLGPIRMLTAEFER